MKTFLSSLLLAAAIAGGSFARADAAGDADADRLFEKGKAAYNAGKIDDAYAAYKQAFALKRTHDIAGNLAQTELSLGKTRDAAEHLSFALAHFPPTAPQERRATLERALEGARKKTASMHVEVTIVGADVMIDGERAGTSPLADEIFVLPGTHTIEAKKVGYMPASRKVDTSAGSTASVALTLEVDRTTPVPTPHPPEPKSVPLIVGGSAIGAVGVAVGVVLLATAGNKASSADAQAASIRARGGYCDSPVPPGFQGDCDALGSVNSTQKLDAILGGVLVASGGAVLGATVLYAIWPRKSNATALAPYVGPKTGGLALHGTF